MHSNFAANGELRQNTTVHLVVGFRQAALAVGGGAASQSERSAMAKDKLIPRIQGFSSEKTKEPPKATTDDPSGITAFKLGQNPGSSVKGPVDAVKKWPFCAELIKAEAVKCRYCQSNV